MQFGKFTTLHFVFIMSLSFTIVGNSLRDIKRDIFTNCYSTGLFHWIPSCNQIIELICEDELVAEGNYLSFSTFGGFTSSKECDGDNIICCISFEDGGILNPCPSNPTYAVKVSSPGQVKDYTGTNININHFVRIREVACKTQ